MANVIFVGFCHRSFFAILLKVNNDDLINCYRMQFSIELSIKYDRKTNL